MSYTIVLRLIGLASLLAIAGCEVKTYTDTVPVAGGLHTPEGLVPFKRVSSEKLAKKLGLNLLFYRGATHSPIYADGYSSKIIFNPTSPYNSLKILSLGDNKAIDININEAFYQVNNKHKKPLLINDFYKKIKTGKHSHNEKGFSYYASRYIEIPSPELFNEKYDHTFRYYLPYTLDDKPYLLDVTVEFKKNYDLELNISFPGSP
jgi:hypothetical protein